MAKKTNPTKTEHRSVTSVGELRASRAVDAVTPAFVEWCRQTEDLPTEAALEILKPVKAFVAAYFHASAASEATNFDPLPFGLAVGEIIGRIDEDDEDEVTFVFESIHLYVEFLGETETWTGTEEDFNAVDDLFHMDEEESPPEVLVPNLTQAEELAGLEGTALAQRMESLLRWTGAGRAVTSTGALRLKDVEGAAAAVGVAAKGALPNAKREQLPFFELEKAPSDAVRTVKSMHAVPLLAKIWLALDVSGLIDIGSTKVWPTPLAEDFLEPRHPCRLEVLRDFTAKFLAIAVMGEDEWAPWVTHAAMAQSTILYTACAQEPVPAGALRDPAELQTLGLDDFGAGILQERMDELAELGLVTLDGVIAVPPAVVLAVMSVVQGVFRDTDEDDYDPWEAESKPQTTPLKRKTRKSGPPAQLLQLKVMLKGSKPPIWRRLQVRSNLTLAELHHIIQASFEWQGYHLHDFRVGGWGGAVYGPADDDFGFGDPPLDESAVEVGELLAAEKDALTYTYDFGDAWKHAVTVEKVLPYDDGDPAARCTGGRGAGPVEDSGGVWGWQEMVAAVNDPTHENHADFREWLGLGPGETLDPKAFDHDEVDEELLDMF
ncbi:MAG: plasmid pRiA4b ORF-3 family protein [Specibacter sp.]